MGAAQTQGAGHAAAAQGRGPVWSWPSMSSRGCGPTHQPARTACSATSTAARDPPATSSPFGLPWRRRPADPNSTPTVAISNGWQVPHGGVEPQLSLAGRVGDEVSDASCLGSEAGGPAVGNVRAAGSEVRVQESDAVLAPGVPDSWKTTMLWLV